MLSEILFSIVILLIGYCFGCFSTGYIVGKMKGTDIREAGSGNIGTTNALRTMGAKVGIITFAGDLLKAFIPTLVVRFAFCAHMGYAADLTYLMTLLAGLGVVIGHNFPFYLHFKGGKGIAVSAAVIIVSSTDLVMILIWLAAFILIVAITRYVSLGSLLVVWYIPVYTCIYYHASSYFIIILLLSLLFTILAYIKHAGNIRRLFNGTERKFGEKKEKENK